MQPTLPHIVPPPREDVQPQWHYLLAPEKIECISIVLKRFMQEERPFLRTGYCIRDLADDIEIPAYQLSAYVNQVLGMNFSEYFNWFRVHHCRQLMEDGQVERLNLRGLAYRCGFNNRNTLTTAFKKITGVTPSDYSRSVEPIKELYDISF